MATCPRSMQKVNPFWASVSPLWQKTAFFVRLELAGTSWFSFRCMTYPVCLVSLLSVRVAVLHFNAAPNLKFGCKTSI